jgi:xyloglucan:xyloglucosyl transferase
VALTVEKCVPLTAYSSMESKQSWQYGGIGAWIKLAKGYTAGTVTTLYVCNVSSHHTDQFTVGSVALPIDALLWCGIGLTGMLVFLVQLSSSGPNHCEFDYEFLGNVTGQPYLMHTNICVNGVGGREIQFYLWFDPTKDYHYYNVQWNKDLVVFYVDNTPVREFPNLVGKAYNASYPTACPMKLYLSMWDGSQWATEGGRVKLDWSQAPFTASYKDFRLRGCKATQGDWAAIKRCQNSIYGAPGPKYQTIGATRTRKLRWVKRNFVHYNYCADTVRYPQLPVECSHIVL